MGGSKPFGSGEDFPPRSPVAGKTIFTINPGDPFKFTDLADTIASYLGHAGKFLVVNSTENGIEVSTASSILAAIALLDSTLDGVTDILEADPLKFGVDIDMEQYELKKVRLEQLASDPSTPVNGQMWYNTTTKIAKIYQNDAVQPFFSAVDALALSGLVEDVQGVTDDLATAQELLNNITDDGILSGSEKPTVVKEYNILINEQAGIDAQATKYDVTTEKSSYDVSITSLKNYIEALDPAYDDYDTDTTITRDDFIGYFSDVYAARQVLINKLHDNVKTLLDDVQDDYADAKAASDAAAASAEIALTELNGISADGFLSKAEKQKVILDYSILLTEQTGIDDEATVHVAFTGMSAAKTAYDDAVTALTSYLDGLDPDYDDTSEDTVINRIDFNTAFADVYDTRQELLNLITRACKKLADDAQTDATQALSDASDAADAAGVAKEAADAADAKAVAARALVDSIASDIILSAGSEKSKIKLEVDDILAEQILLDVKAEVYEITDEKDDYDDAITSLIVYLDGLTPAWDNLALDTPITPDSATFRNKFLEVYNTRNALYLLIYDKAQAAAVVTASNAADETFGARMGVLLDPLHGLVLAGFLEVGDQNLEGNNAGLSGLVSGTPATDIRFWAGTTQANRATAPFRVQHDGTMYASKAVIAGGWIVDTEAIYFGTKKISDGYATSGITLANDGSIHAKNFYINANGDAAFRGLANGLYSKIVELGDWNMVSTSSYPGTELTWANLGIAGNKVRRVTCIINPDAGSTWHYPLDYPYHYGGTTWGPSGHLAFGSTGITLMRITGGVFDNADYDAISYSRGWVVIDYAP